MVALSRVFRGWWMVLGLVVAGCTPAPVTPVIYLLDTPTVVASAPPMMSEEVALLVTDVPTETPMPTATATITPSPTAIPSVRLMAVGDVMLDRSIAWYVNRDGPGVVFGGVQDAISQADVLVVNLECAIGDVGEPQPKAYTFRAPPYTVEALVAAGVDVVSLANNHALDYGPLALAQTRQLLAERNIAAVGAGGNAAEARTPVVIERNGLRIVFVAYVDVPVEVGGFNTRVWTAGENSPGVAWLVIDEMVADIAAARQQADVVVALLHFGLEGRDQPWDGQIAAARAAIDAGASLVVGAHPHVLQPIEEYNGGLIVYSLGNFVFDGFTGAANESAILDVTLTAEGVVDYAFTPVVVVNGLPQVAAAADEQRILKQLEFATP